MRDLNQLILEAEALIGRLHLTIAENIVLFEAIQKDNQEELEVAKENLSELLLEKMARDSVKE